MTDVIVPEAVQESFGGYLTTRKATPGHQELRTWKIDGFKALDLLEQVRPHLVIERRAALADMVIGDPVVRSRAKGPGSSKVRNNEMLFRAMRARNAVRLDAPPDIPPKRPYERDIPYLAGILDGGGHITANQVIQVTSTDPELPAWCVSRFGGRIYERDAIGNSRTKWAWYRHPTGFRWGARVAEHMLLGRMGR